MPCHYPLQGHFVQIVTKAGALGRKFIPLKHRMDLFKKGLPMPPSDEYNEYGSNPCGRCMDCRLDRSRETGLRALHESRLYEDNCFITLTFSQPMLERYGILTDGGYSLDRDLVTRFIKKVRQKFDNGFEFDDRFTKSKFYDARKIRVFGCGEYGEELGRPHYHLCLFNCNFPDRVKWKKINGFWHYTSSILSSLWSIDGVSLGQASVADFSFETAAYCARYSLKKINGPKAADHYKGRLPEFLIFPTRGGGIGKPWFELYGKSDVVPTDTCLINGAVCKPPRYYDKLREREDPEGFARAKELRAVKAAEGSEDNVWARLKVKEKCMNARIRLLVRNLE